MLPADWGCLAERMLTMGLKLALSLTLGLLLGALSVLLVLDGGGREDCSEVVRERVAKQGSGECSCEEMAKELEYLTVRLRFLEKASSSSSSRILSTQGVCPSPPEGGGCGL